MNAGDGTGRSRGEKRFGVYRVDFETQTRAPKLSASNRSFSLERAVWGGACAIDQAGASA
jgi:hypothetical protein